MSEKLGRFVLTSLEDLTYNQLAESLDFVGKDILELVNAEEMDSERFRGLAHLFAQIEWNYDNARIENITHMEKDLALEE